MPSGKKVVAVAREHGINEMTIRSWLESYTEGGAAQTLEMSRLWREIEAVMEVNPGYGSPRVAIAFGINKGKETSG